MWPTCRFPHLLLAEDGQAVVLAGASGDIRAGLTLPETLSLEHDVLAAAVKSGRPEVLVAGAEPQHGGALPTAASAPGHIVAVPIARQGLDRPLGILVAGTSARLLFDDAYHDFLTLVASQIGAAIAAAQALEEAQARADALAELIAPRRRFSAT